MAGCPARRSFPFVASFDHLGPFARSVGDLALAYDAMQGPDPDDAACTTRPPEPVTALVDAGYQWACGSPSPAAIFRTTSLAEAGEAVARVARALGAMRIVEIPGSRARPRRGLCHHHHAKARRCISIACETRPNDFDPAVRDRLLAGAMIPAPWSTGRKNSAAGIAPGCWSSLNRSM